LALPHKGKSANRRNQVKSCVQFRVNNVIRIIKGPSVDKELYCRKVVMNRAPEREVWPVAQEERTIHNWGGGWISSERN